MLIAYIILTLAQFICFIATIIIKDTPFIILNALLLLTIHPYNLRMAWKFRNY